MGVSWGEGAGERDGGGGPGAGVARGVGRYTDEMRGDGARAAPVCGFAGGAGDSIFCGGDCRGRGETAVFRADRVGFAEGVGELRLFAGESGVGCKSRDGKNQAGGAAGTLADSLKLPQERITTKCSANGLASAQRIRFAKAKRQNHTAKSDGNGLTTTTVDHLMLNTCGRHSTA